MRRAAKPSASRARLRESRASATSSRSASRTEPALAREAELGGESGAHQVLEVAPPEAGFHVGGAALQALGEALDRVAPPFDVGVIGAEHADAFPGLLRDPAGRLVRIRSHAELAADVIARR